MNIFVIHPVEDFPIQLIKKAKYITCTRLARIINSSLVTGYYSDILKVAKVTPLHIGGSKEDVTNYRPISVLSRFNIIFEFIIKERLVKFLNKNNAFASTQFCFRKNYSTTLEIAQLPEYILRAKDKGNAVCCLFLDLTKALDTVNRNILLQNLNTTPLKGYHLNFSNRVYLTESRQLSTNLTNLDYEK